MDGTHAILVRHAPTSWNRLGRFTGRTELELVPDASADLRPTVEALTGRVVDIVLRSPARRVAATEELLRAEGLLAGAPTRVHEGLRELDFGRFEGRTRAELAADPDFEPWLRERAGRPAAPGGETWASAAARAAQALAAVPAGGTAVLLAHGYLLKILVAESVPGLESDWVRDMHLPNGGILELVFTGGGWSLLGAQVVRR